VLKKNRKVGILAYLEVDFGGIFQYTQSLIEALKNDDEQDYVIFCSADDNRFDDYGLEVRKTKNAELNLLQKVIVFFQLLFLVRKPLIFSKDQMKIFQDIDIFISPYISAYPHFFLRKPFVFTLHDMQEEYFPRFFSKFERLKRKLKNKALSKTASKILCESSFVRNDITKFTGVNKNKVIVIPFPPVQNFSNFTFSRAKAEEIKNKYKLPEKFIFYPAQCWFHKNHIKLVEAFNEVAQEVDDVSLVLTGSQQNNYLNLMQNIKELGLSQKVKHLGYVDYEELPYFYKLSQFLVMPTLFESISIPVFEAFALEVAVCCSKVVALPEQVGDAGIFFDPYNADDIADKMLLYLKDEKLRIEKAKKGLKKIKKFEFQNFEKKLLKTLRS
jgi:glycosyltransferase involved in cell wall biosynthesis